MKKLGFLFPKHTYNEECKTITTVRYGSSKSIVRPVGTNYNEIYDFRCTCGCVCTFLKGSYENGFDKSFVVCPSCKSNDVKVFKEHFKTKMFNSSFSLIKFEGKSLEIVSKRYKALFKSDGSLTIKELGLDRVIYEHPKIKAIDYKEREYNDSDNTFDRFLSLRGIENRELLKAISSDSYLDYDYLLFLLKNFKNRSRTYYGVECLRNSLNYHFSNPIIEKLYRLDFHQKFIIELVKDYSSIINTNEKKLNKMLGVSKAGLRFLKNQNYIDGNGVSRVVSIQDSIGEDNFNKIIDIMEQETMPLSYDQYMFIYYLLELHNIGYNNTVHLTSFLCRRTKLEQGFENPLEAIRYLKDYVRMSVDLGFEYEKYPQSLKKVHDIASMNTNILKKAIETEKFNKIIEKEDYKSLEFKNKEYSIIAPKSADDVIKEGELLSHCVASYVKDIANGLCKILFLRNKNDEDKPYMTIEVRADKVVQFKGISNSRASADDLEVLEKWAEKKSLRIPNKNSL